MTIVNQSFTRSKETLLAAFIAIACIMPVAYYLYLGLDLFGPTNRPSLPGILLQVWIIIVIVLTWHVVMTLDLSACGNRASENG